MSSMMLKDLPDWAANSAIFWAGFLVQLDVAVNQL